MNPNIKKLAGIAAKDERLIIGLMSGTSLDGLDLALCLIEGCGLKTIVKLLQFESVPYADDFKTELRSVFSKKTVELEKLCLLHPWIAKQHAAIINDCVKKWGLEPTAIDLLASHGQTVYHAPLRHHQHQKFGNATLQIGDGDHLAVATGIITISDFRQKHIAAGGEGAPLAIYGDHLLFGKAGEDRILLNIGGIANFTFIPAIATSEMMISTDTGPGNTLMDALIQQQFPGKYFDENGIAALNGKINNELLDALKSHPFFDQQFPKTTGPELFNLAFVEAAKKQSGTTVISVEDTMATLNMFTADTISSAIKQCTKNKHELNIICSGGGIHNPVLMQHLKDQLPKCTFITTAALGMDPDAKEAVLFALLANECVAGNKEIFGKGIPGMPAVSMGKISLPD